MGFQLHTTVTVHEQHYILQGLLTKPLWPPIHLEEISLKMLENTLVNHDLPFSMDSCTHIQLIMTDTDSLIHNYSHVLKTNDLLSVIAN